MSNGYDQHVVPGKSFVGDEVIAVVLIAGGVILAFVPSVVMENFYEQAKKAAEKDGYSFPASAKDLKDIPLVYDVGIALLVFGIFLFVVSTLGWCGSCCTSCCRWMLVLFCIVMALLMIAEIVVGTLFYVTNSPMHKTIKDELKKKIKSDYNENSNDPFSAAINLINENFKCCGIDNKGDFLPSKPPKSCRTYIDQGCYKKMTDLIDENIIWAGLVLAGILLFQLIEIIFAIVIYKSNNKVGPV